MSSAFAEQVSQRFFNDLDGFSEISRARQLQYNMFTRYASGEAAARGPGSVRSLAVLRHELR